MVLKMATSLLISCSNLFHKFCAVGVPQNFTQTVRWASKKAGTSTRNRRTNTKSKKRGAKKLDGDYVESGMILCRQLGLKVYPGLNVGCGRDLTLYALRPGRVMITLENLVPYPESPLYPAVSAGREFKKYFFHVLPIDAPTLGRFRKISSV